MSEAKKGKRKNTSIDWEKLDESMADRYGIDYDHQYKKEENPWDYKEPWQK